MRLAVAVGINVEVLEIEKEGKLLSNKEEKSKNKTAPESKRLILEGHSKRIRSLAIDESVKIVPEKTKTEFIVSVADDNTIRKW